MIDETVKLPAVLRGKLQFGNRAQIDALAEIERQITEQEKCAKRKKEYAELKAQGKLKYFRVKVTYKGHEYLDVWAKDKEAACDIAETMGDSFDVDLEIDDIYAIETNPPDNKAQK